MPFKIHLERIDPVTRVRLPEGDPLKTVETSEEAEAELRRFGESGIRNAYAVGYDWPPGISAN